MPDKQLHIIGIHNYCDRWCERCMHTRHCAVFEKTENLTPEQQDIHNKAFWDNISDNFKQGINMLHEIAEKRGIDLKNISIEDEKTHTKLEEQIENQIKRTELIRLWEKYVKMTQRLIDNNNWLKFDVEQIEKSVNIGILSEAEAIEKVNQLKEYVEIIQWYLHFFMVKFQRAYHGKLENDYENDLNSDYNGSAKIALIAIQKSIEAWAGLYMIFPEKEDELLIILSLLQQIKRIGESEYPNAYMFVRPGFDE